MKMVTNPNLNTTWQIMVHLIEILSTILVEIFFITWENVNSYYVGRKNCIVLKMASEVHVAQQICSLIFIHFYPCLSIFHFINFHPCHPLSSTLIHFHPLSSTFINFHLQSSTFIHFHLPGSWSVSYHHWMVLNAQTYKWIGLDGFDGFDGLDLWMLVC